MSGRSRVGNRHSWELLFLLLCTVYLVNIGTSATQPTITPSTHTAFLHPDRKYPFHCTGGGERDGIFWEVDGLTETNTEIRGRGIYSETSVKGESTLFVPLTVANNGTLLKCFSVTELGVNTSLPASLWIQGLLTAPQNLKFEVYEDSISARLVWSAPFTLNVSGVDPDISTYTICNNITGYCSNISHGSGVMEYVFPSVCVPVEFRVSAVNGAGQGKEAEILFETDSNCYNVSIAEAPTILSEDGKPNIEAGIFSIAFVLGLLLFMFFLGVFATGFRHRHKESLHEILVEDEALLSRGRKRDTRLPRDYDLDTVAVSAVPEPHHMLSKTDKELEAQLEREITGKTTQI